jgi:hypothetical protein
LVVGGCGSIAAPKIFHPGSAEYQQSRAQRWDPYPQTDVAPDIDGGRPRQYLRPAPQTERMQDEVTFEERFGQAAPQGTYRTPRTTIGNRQSIVFPPPGDPQLAPSLTQ